MHAPTHARMHMHTHTHVRACRCPTRPAPATGSCTRNGPRSPRSRTAAPWTWCRRGSPLGAPLTTMTAWPTPLSAPPQSSLVSGDHLHPSSFWVGLSRAARAAFHRLASELCLVGVGAVLWAPLIEYLSVQVFGWVGGGYSCHIHESCDACACAWALFHSPSGLGWTCAGPHSVNAHACRKHVSHLMGAQMYSCVLQTYCGWVWDGGSASGPRQ